MPPPEKRLPEEGPNKRFPHRRRHPDEPDGPEKVASWKALSEKYPFPERLFAGKLSDGSVAVGLRDSRGRVRIRLSIGSNDRTEVVLLNEEGKTIWSTSRSAEESSAAAGSQQR